VKIAVVLHGEATKSALNEEFYRARFQVEQNPNLTLIRELQMAGVEVFVCGQALNYKGFPESAVVGSIPIADSALTVNVNKQTAGYAGVAVP
jgi:intracellular sulfur oxidation DsrE/DsrF family protein